MANREMLALADRRGRGSGRGSLSSPKQRFQVKSEMQGLQAVLALETPQNLRFQGYSLPFGVNLRHVEQGDDV